MASNSGGRGRGRNETLPAMQAGSGGEPQPAEPPPPAEPSPYPPVHFRPTPGFGSMTVRETRALPASWPRFLEPGADACPDEVRAHRTLEQVGSILRRLELDQLEIDRLRSETRTMLRGLAA